MRHVRRGVLHGQGGLRRRRRFRRSGGERPVSCVVFVPHTTAGVTINENADPDVKSDILWALGRIVPEAGHFSHREGNSDAHVKASLLGSSVWLPLREGRLDLGVWQTVYLAEFDGPRARQVKVVFQE